MLSNILNCIPVVGHVKGVLHFLNRDYEGCRIAMYESTRSAAVMGGGTLGMVGGPAGMALGGTVAGLFVDSVTTAATGKTEGSITGVQEIANDITHGKIPLQSIVKIGIMIGCDALCGMGGGAVTNVVEKSVQITAKSMKREIVKAVVKSSGKRIMIAGIYTRATITSERWTMDAHVGTFSEPPPSSKSESEPPSSAESRSESERSSGSKPPSSTAGGSGSERRSGSKPPSSAASGSGSEPPEKNERNDKKSHEIEEPTPDSEHDHWSIFLEIFQAESLDDISIRGCNIFTGFVRGRRNTLKKLIKRLRAEGYLKEIIKLVVEILNNNIIAKKDIVFENFLSLTQFVETYIADEVARHETEMRATDTKESSFENLKQCAMRNVMDDTSTLTTNILNTFKNLWEEISKFSFEPYFRNIVSAISHYYKHRVFRKKGIVFTISEYIDLIKSLLKKLKTLKVYTKLGSNRYEITFDRYFEKYETRVRIVVKFQGGQVVLSSCYLRSDCYDNDKDGQEFIDLEEIDET